MSSGKSIPKGPVQPYNSPRRCADGRDRHDDPSNAVLGAGHRIGRLICPCDLDFHGDLIH